MNLVQNGFVPVQHFLLLIVICESHLVSPLQISLCRFNLAHHDLQQRSLSDSVGPDNADALPALDVEIHIPEKLPAVSADSEGLAQPFSDKHIVSALEILMETNLHLPGLLLRTIDPLYVSQPLFPGSRPFREMLRPALLEAPDDVLLPSNLLLLLFISAEIHLSLLPFLFRERGIVSVVGLQPVMLDLKDSGTHLIQEIPVVGNQHNGTFVVPQELLQPFQHTDIKVISGLVQQKEVWLSHQQARQRKTGPLSAGECGDFFVVIFLSKGHAGENPLHLTSPGKPSLAPEAVLQQPQALHCPAVFRRFRIPFRRHFRNTVRQTMNLRLHFIKLPVNAMNLLH